MKMIVLAFFLQLSPQACKVLYCKDLYFLVGPMGWKSLRTAHAKVRVFVKKKRSILTNYFTFQVILLLLLGTLSDNHQVNLTFMSNLPLLPQLRSHFTLSPLKDGASSSNFRTWWMYYHIKRQDSQIEDSSWQTKSDRASAFSTISSSIVISCSYKLLLQLLLFLYIKKLLPAEKKHNRIFREKI